MLHSLSLRRKLALKHHPDKNPDNKEKAEKKVTNIAPALAGVETSLDPSSVDYGIQEPICAVSYNTLHRLACVRACLTGKCVSVPAGAAH
jgi:hypothetical protein